MGLSQSPQLPTVWKDYRRIETTVNERTHLVSFLLRVGIAVVFLYAAIASFLEPTSWIGYLPGFMSAQKVVPVTTILSAFSLYQLLLAGWVLSGKKTLWAGLLAAATLGAIIITNINQLDIVFRDVAIFFAALALCALHYKGDLPARTL